MGILVRLELLKTFRKWRTFIGFLAIGLIIPLVHVAFKLEGGSAVRSVTRALEGDFFLAGNLFNTYFITQLILNSLWVHVPFLISLVAGDSLAGEATAGTFRLLLIRPPSRSAILLAKYLTTLLYTASLVLLLFALSLGLGVVLFGTGDLLVPGRILTVLPEALLPGRMALAFALALAAMWCVASLAFFFSSLVENAVGPIVGTMAVLVVFLVLGSLPMDLSAQVRPYLFTSHMNVWQSAFADPLPWDTVRTAVAWLAGHAIGFYLATWYIFARKDILS